MGIYTHRYVYIQIYNILLHTRARTHIQYLEASRGDFRSESLQMSCASLSLARARALSLTQCPEHLSLAHTHTHAHTHTYTHTHTHTHTHTLFVAGELWRFSRRELANAMRQSKN